MKKLRAILVLGMIALAMGTTHYAWAQAPGKTETPAGSKPEGVVSATVVTVHGTIADVNKDAKQVTLEAPKIGKVTLDVQNPYNLDAAKVGSPFVARYYEVVTIRKKKPGESVPNASLKTGLATARPGALPGAVEEQHIGLLVSVAAIDEAQGTVTVKAPDGTVETVKARNPENLKRLKVGDDLVIGISRAIAITLDKEKQGGTS